MAQESTQRRTVLYDMDGDAQAIKSVAHTSNNPETSILRVFIFSP
jgi:hypothetical protein